ISTPFISRPRFSVLWVAIFLEIFLDSITRNPDTSAYPGKSDAIDAEARLDMFQRQDVVAGFELRPRQFPFHPFVLGAVRRQGGEPLAVQQHIGGTLGDVQAVRPEPGEDAERAAFPHAQYDRR